MKINNEPIYVTLDGCKGALTGADYAEGQFLIKPYLTHREKNDVLRLTELLLQKIERNQNKKIVRSPGTPRCKFRIGSKHTCNK